MRVHKDCGPVRESLIGRRAVVRFLDKQAFVLVMDLFHVGDVVGVELVVRNSLQLGQALRKLRS
jgi:hypothetical protein